MRIVAFVIFLSTIDANFLGGLRGIRHKDGSQFVERVMKHNDEPGECQEWCVKEECNFASVSNKGQCILDCLRDYHCRPNCQHWCAQHYCADDSGSGQCVASCVRDTTLGLLQCKENPGHGPPSQHGPL